MAEQRTFFGVEVQSASHSRIKCDWCGTWHNKDETGVGDSNGDSILHVTFDGKTICDCCFERFEKEIIRRMPQILPWFAGLLNKKSKWIKDIQESLRKVASKIVFQ